MITRRSLLLALSGAAIGAALPAFARTGDFAVGAIRVDASALGPQGWGGNAGRIAQALEAELAGRLAPLRRNGAPTLRVTVGSLRLGSGAGGMTGGGGGGDDSIDSMVELVSGGRVLFSRRILVQQPDSSGGAWYNPEADNNRIAKLIEDTARWTQRYLGA